MLRIRGEGLSIFEGVEGRIEWRGAGSRTGGVGAEWTTVELEKDVGERGGRRTELGREVGDPGVIAGWRPS